MLEGIPNELAARITAELPIPTIGIGAGPQCDGQVLVCYDLLGLTPERVPRFVKKYETFYEKGVAAMARFRQEVQGAVFPDAAHSFGVGVEQVHSATGSSAGSATLSGGRLHAAAPGGREPMRG